MHEHVDHYSEYEETHPYAVICYSMEGTSTRTSGFSNEVGIPAILVAFE